MEFVIFKNPKVKYRGEDFGGIVESDFQFYILNKKQYKFLKNLNKFKYYDSLKKDEKKIVDKFLEKKILLKIESKRAEKIIKTKK